MANFKIAITAGHYLGTAGKRCLKSLDPNETREWVLNNRIADKVKALQILLTGYGFDCGKSGSVGSATWGKLLGY